MLHLLKSLSVLSILFLAACSGINRMPSTYASATYDADVIEHSLFASQDKTISEEDIQRLLNGQIKIKDSLRIAIFNYSIYSQRNIYPKYYRTDEEYLKTQQAYIHTLTSQIENCKKIKKTFLMPSMMVDTKSSITNLRETAVRLQADLLLVYNVKSDIYYKYKTFKADEAKAFATIECFLMDTRTGLIPFTTITTEESFMKKTSDDFTTDELRRNTEKEAVIKALETIGVSLNGYLEGA